MITLKLQDIQFMLTTLELSPNLRSMLKSLTLMQDKSISNDIADEIRDLCTERFDVYGLDENYKPTKEGDVLESLIDKLYIDQ